MDNEIYSPGLEGVVAGETAVSTLAGGLQYRGYPIEELATHSTFEETAYLLLYGELPNVAELDGFRSRLGAAANVCPQILEILRQIPAATPCMDVLRTCVSLLGHWDPDAQDTSHAANLRKAERLLAQLPVLLAAHWRHCQQLPLVPPDAQRGLADNLLWMLHGEPPSPRAARALDVSLILYAEHEYNASTFAARVVASTLSDLHSAVTAAVGALKGPLHGGANEHVLSILQAAGSPEQAEAWVRGELAARRRIMGFGHRVYKQSDPRAEYLKVLCRDLAEETGNSSLEAIAETIERVVRREKNLPPNLDWPSARIYHYLKLPVALYTPLFVLSRVAGWCAHIIEQQANNRLIRPRSRYIGRQTRSWVPLVDR
ncbi:MAG: citrate synthase [Pirellulales bacterium]|jgi:citrate synthase|nr:citrate synthase [Pirellulales bacterium]